MKHLLSCEFNIDTACVELKFADGSMIAIDRTVQRGTPQGCRRAGKERKFKEERKMKVLSCEFNIDTACVELRLEGGTLIAIDCTAVENEVADNMYERSELDYLVYNAPLEYADLILNGNPVKYLKTVTVYKSFEN